MKDFLNFIRAGMLPLTMIVPALGYWGNIEGFGELYNIIALLAIGANAHIFGFGLNDIVDREIDKHAAYRNDSPLVTRNMKLGLAWFIVLIQLPLMFFFYHITDNTLEKITGDIFLAVSIFLSIVYNFFSKKGLVKRWIAEVSLALSISFLCMAGSYMFNYTITVSGILFSIAFGLVLLSVNSIGSGLKDLKTDLEAGGKSFVIANGARMIGEDQMFIPKRLKIYGYLLQLTMVVVFAIYHWNLQFIGVVFIFPLLFLLMAFFHLMVLLSQKKLSQLYSKGPLLYGYFNLLALILLELLALWLKK